MDTSIMNLERDDLYTFCDLLPEPIIAKPVATATRNRGMTLAIEYEGKRALLTERGKPCKFNSIDAVMFELDGAPNVDTSALVIETASYWKF
ncbi:hypothetical protein A1507_09875 [Methylomonas koyamae]|uniref:Uncharacterized protein n=1 Tax=Methylomonas koyamae TaxID=702114 RepID=A0A177NK17_9GAMM|nr:hypothetical protein [Methylomonas koyamae]OAI18231.1 hypothetical protein A1507_09875 [Methylomonas koyamae]